MTNEEIAKALLETGILYVDRDVSDLYWPQGVRLPRNFVPMTAGECMASWLVAGACLERMRHQGLEILVVARTGDMTEIVVTDIAIGPGYGDALDRQLANIADESMPRAICEAFANTVSEGR